MSSPSRSKVTSMPSASAVPSGLPAMAFVRTALLVVPVPPEDAPLAGARRADLLLVPVFFVFVPAPPSDVRFLVVLRVAAPLAGSPATPFAGAALDDALLDVDRLTAVPFVPVFLAGALFVRVRAGLVAFSADAAPASSEVWTGFLVGAVTGDLSNW